MQRPAAFAFNLLRVFVVGAGFELLVRGAIRSEAEQLWVIAYVFFESVAVGFVITRECVERENKRALVARDVSGLGEEAPALAAETEVPGIPEITVLGAEVSVVPPEPPKPETPVAPLFEDDYEAEITRVRLAKFAHCIVVTIALGGAVYVCVVLASNAGRTVWDPFVRYVTIVGVLWVAAAILFCR